MAAISAAFVCSRVIRRRRAESRREESAAGIRQLIDVHPHTQTVLLRAARIFSESAMSK